MVLWGSLFLGLSTKTFVVLQIVHLWFDAFALTFEIVVLRNELFGCEVYMLTLNPKLKP